MSMTLRKAKDIEVLVKWVCPTCKYKNYNKLVFDDDMPHGSVKNILVQFDTCAKCNIRVKKYELVKFKN
jgi:C4-type Zn-finger protein